MPANRSSSGSEVRTRVRANSNSSVGHTLRCTSAGTAKKGPFGSIWVAWARRASSRASKKSAHGTCVVTRSMMSPRSDTQRFSGSPKGLGRPRST